MFVVIARRPLGGELHAVSYILVLVILVLRTA